ncbi:MAG: NAD-dependent epimerase/dehydratase family protein, partial [Bradymonadaceae bacterium]
LELTEPGSAVVYSVPTLFREYDEAREPPRHVAPVARALEAAADAGAERFVYLSSTSVYGDHDGAWVDEDVEPAPASPMGKMRRDIEEFVLERGPAQGVSANVARLVGIYGPGRTLVDYLRSGRYRLVDGGTKPTNRIHVDDIVRVLRAIVERGPEGARLYNVSDGSPKTAREVVDWAVEHLDVEPPEEISLEAYADQRGPNAVARWANTYRVDNTRMVEELGVAPEYADVFEGYRAIFEL